MGENEQQRSPDRADGRATRVEAGVESGTEPDVLLDIPEVSVDSIRLTADGLDADLSLRARLANLLQLDAGLRVHVEGVELDASGVHAQALLKVRLEKVVAILERAMATIDQNPQLIADLSRAVVAPPGEATGTGQRLATDGVHLTATAQQTAGSGSGRAGSGGSGAAGGSEAAGGDRGGSPARGPGLASGSGGGGERGEAVRTRERQEASSRRAAGSREEAPDRSGRSDGVDEDKAASGGASGTADAGDRQRSGHPASAGGAAQFAEQAGETLRQAGRSVWGAVQETMANRRQQDH